MFDAITSTDICPLAKEVFPMNDAPWWLTCVIVVVLVSVFGVEYVSARQGGRTTARASRRAITPLVVLLGVTLLGLHLMT